MTATLADDERLVFAPGERPPPFDPDRQPAAPEAGWSGERLAKARRNYAAEFIRTGIRALAAAAGDAKALDYGKRAARLTGLQHYRRMAEAVDGVDGGPQEAAAFLAAMFRGMGDGVEVREAGNGAVSPAPGGASGSRAASPARSAKPCSPAGSSSGAAPSPPTAGSWRSRSRSKPAPLLWTIRPAAPASA